MWTVRKRHSDLRLAIALCLVWGGIAACGDDAVQPPSGGYSGTVAPILGRSCATSGCHDAGTASAGLDLSSYAGVLAGSDYGEAVIPFEPERSLMIALLDGSAASTHVDHTASARSVRSREVAALRDWVGAGCPDDDGRPAFSTLTEKLYVTSQNADLISVLSIEDLVVTRLIRVEPFPGSGGLNALPHFGVVSRDNRHWIVTMLNAPGLWKFDRRDSVLARLRTPRGAAALAVMTPDGQKVYVTHFIESGMPSLGYVSVIDVETFSVLREIPVLNTSHGIAIAPDGSEVYVGNFGSDHITVIDTSDDSIVDHIPLSERVRGNIDSFEFRLVQLTVHPTRPLIYATCSATNEIRVIDRLLGTVVDSVTVPAGSAAPWHLELTADGSKLYVANRGQQMMGGHGLLPGSVSIFNTDPLALVKNITADALWLPHGVEFDRTGRYCFVTCENANGGYRARHPMAGADPPGTLVVIDTATDDVVKVLEVGPFASGVFATR